MLLSFDDIKDYFDKGLWSQQMVKIAVVKKKISPEEYQVITREIYA